MPDQQGAARRSFIAELKRLRRQAGEPSMPEMRKISEQLVEAGQIGVPVTRSTISDVLAGSKRTHVPSWPWVLAFLETCRAAAAAARLDTQALGSTAEWNMRWQAAKTAEEAENITAGQCPTEAAAIEPPIQKVADKDQVSMSAPNVAPVAAEHQRDEEELAGSA